MSAKREQGRAEGAGWGGRHSQVFTPTRRRMHRLSSPASAESAREGDPVCDAGDGKGGPVRTGAAARLTGSSVASSAARLSPGGIVYWVPFPRPFGPRRG